MSTVSRDKGTDIILAMSHTLNEDYMQMIILQQKDHEFRRKLYPSSVKRIWFYETAPTSAITYICEIGPAVVRPSVGRIDERWKLKEGGIGNKEYNDYHPDWNGYDYAYPIYSCWRIKQPISLNALKDFGLGGAPRGMVYVPEKMQKAVVWVHQELTWKDAL